MLQIKNTLGGGKPEGLYVWKKYSVSVVDNLITKSDKNYTLGTATSDTTVYYSTSYTFDASTGMYTLVNPQSATLVYNGSGGVASVQMEKSKYYIWGATSSNEIYNTNANSKYNVAIRNASGTVYLELNASDYKCDIHSAKAEYTFLDYIVSDKETAYPDGGEKGGYWYEKVSEGIAPETFGCTKYAVDTFTLASNTVGSEYSISHSLGTKPKYFIIIGDYSGVTKSTYDIISVMGANHNLSGTFNYANLSYWGGSKIESSYTSISLISSVEFRVNNPASYFKANVKYTVITMA